MRYIFILICALLTACTSSKKQDLIVVSSRPAYLILHEIVGENIPIKTLLDPAASPHTYSPGPGDINASSKSTIVFYLADDLDGWAADLHNNNTIELINFLPDSMKLHAACEHHHEGEHHHHEGEHHHHDADTDPHFWLNPLAVKAILPDLVKSLSSAFPDYAEDFSRKSFVFADKLISLDANISQVLKSKQGKYIFTFHPSFNYFIKQYGFISGGSIEAAPGKEPSPIYIKELSDRITLSNTKVIFSEPQFSEVSAKTVAELTGTKLAVLDPLGSSNTIKSYFDLLNFNTKTLTENL